MTYRVETDEHGPWQDIDEPFIVPTPSPYIIDLAHHPTDKGQMIARLLYQVQCLREFMAALGITEQEGRNLGLTLDGKTWELLYNRALRERQFVLAAQIMNARHQF